jgi:probable HAF family extracellular repeat protein
MESPRIVQLALFAMVVFGGVETAFADVIYSFTTIDAPGATGGTQASGINNSGQIVGIFEDATGIHGFVDTGGSFTTIDVVLLGTPVIFPFGINDSSQIVGRFDDGRGIHGIRVDTGGGFTTIDVPGATRPLPAGSTIAARSWE